MLPRGNQKLLYFPTSRK